MRNLLLMFPRRWLAKRVAANIGPSDYTGRRIELPRTRTIYHGIEDPLALGPYFKSRRSRFASLISGAWSLKRASICYCAPLES